MSSRRRPDLSANHRGLYDMGGNVAEWMHDVYSMPNSSGIPVVDPLGAQQGSNHVIRGASWAHGTVTELRLSFRDYGQSGRDDVGFGWPDLPRRHREYILALALLLGPAGRWPNRTAPADWRNRLPKTSRPTPRNRGRTARRRMNLTAPEIEPVCRPTPTKIPSTTAPPEQISEDLSVSFPVDI